MWGRDVGQGAAAPTPAAPHALVPAAPALPDRLCLPCFPNLFVFFLYYYYFLFFPPCPQAAGAVPAACSAGSASPGPALPGAEEGAGKALPPRGARPRLSRWPRAAAKNWADVICGPSNPARAHPAGARRRRYGGFRGGRLGWGPPLHTPSPSAASMQCPKRLKFGAGCGNPRPWLSPGAAQQGAVGVPGAPEPRSGDICGCPPPQCTHIPSPFLPELSPFALP